MLHHILVPLDGSKLAEEALGHALNIIGTKGRITLISAVEVPEVPLYSYYPPAVVPDYESANKDLLPAAKSYLEGIITTLKRDDVEFNVEIHLGEAAEVITEAAQRLKVDAIVMSTHGRSGLSRWLFGSVTNKVLSAKPCPVYVIPSSVSGNGSN